MTVTSNYISRYTDLPFLIDYLRTKELPLLSPQSWDDRNDSHYILSYAKLARHTAVYALCLTEAPETYHHWKVFTSGSSGVCIEFHKDKLLSYAKQVSGIRAERVNYKKLSELRKCKPTQEQLPFLKRVAFSDEKEFRLVVSNFNEQLNQIRLHMPSVAIRKIIFNPWMPKTVFEEIKNLLKDIDGCKSIRVSRSTLIDNDEWKSLGCKLNPILQQQGTEITVACPLWNGSSCVDAP